MSDPKTLAIAALDEEPQVIAELPAREPVLLGSREFAHMVDEAAVHLSVALALAGLDDSFEVDASAPGSTGDVHHDLPSEPEDGSRLIKFMDAEGNELPVYVSCLDDGRLLCVVQNDDGTHAFADERTMAEIGELVDDVRCAIETVIPASTYH